MLHFETPQTVILNLSVPSGATDLFVRATVFNSAGSSVHTVALSHVSRGLYSASFLATVLGVGNFSALIEVFTDAGFTTSSTEWGSHAVELVIQEPVAARVLSEPVAGHVASGTVAEALVVAAQQGYHSLMDGGAGFAAIQYDANNNLTSMRLRLFATVVARDAATAGAADGADGELVAFYADAMGYENAASGATVQRLTGMTRYLA